MPDHAADSTLNLDTLQTELLEKARASSARRAAATVFGGHGSPLRQTAMALLRGTELGEHDSPPAASLQVLTGSVVLIGDGREWRLGGGDLVGIPPERHSVSALEDSVFLLTVLRTIPAADD